MQILQFALMQESTARPWIPLTGENDGPKDTNRIG